MIMKIMKVARKVFSCLYMGSILVRINMRNEMKYSSWYYQFEN